MEYILILLQHNSPSFCYYNNSSSEVNSDNIMSLENFRSAIQFANKNNLKITILHGTQGMTEPYLLILEGLEYSVITPAGCTKTYDNQIYIVDYEGNDEVFYEIPSASFQNIILRLESIYFSDLVEIIQKHLIRFKRINLFIKDIETLSSNKLSEYREVLQTIAEITYENIILSTNSELNFLTDRMFLDKMNNCDAGIKHITIAPNGMFYLCPGFYYDDDQKSVGSSETGIEIKGNNLLRLENAPICNICDALHCKRCIYLNKKMTFELNTPSHEQCVLSHFERNETKRLVDNLRMFARFSHIPHIPHIGYLDPFEIVKSNPAIRNGWQMIDKKISKDIGSLSEKELLNMITDIQIELQSRSGELIPNGLEKQ